MATSSTPTPRVTRRGIARNGNGWIALEQDFDARDDIEASPLAARLIEGPFTGTGAKRAAIQAAGTNLVL